MKKIIALLLLIALVFSFSLLAVSCGDNDMGNDDGGKTDGDGDGSDKDTGGGSTDIPDIEDIIGDGGFEGPIIDVEPEDH